jgi:putative colanic acid biosynthesis UDP-glucose lipid carrier transferase
MLMLAAGVKLSSRGPVFYRQRRVGMDGKEFDMLKFRSMPVDIESQGVQWGNAGNKKTTRFGRVIRATSLDELPQFINVLRGELSIVGPRPERPMFVHEFKHTIPGYMHKHFVKGGITGWAQIHGLRGDTDLTKRIEYDLHYIKNWSLWLDIKIMLRTPLVLLKRTNAV